MSEPIWVTVTIGGTIKKADVPDLLGAIDEDINELSGPSLKGSGKVEGPYWRGYANWGEIDSIKTFCEEHNLSYQHDCGATSEYNASVTYWLPGMKKEKWLQADSENTLVVPVESIRPYLDMLITIMKDGVESLPLFIEHSNERIKEIVTKALRSKKPHEVLEKEFKKILPEAIPKIPDLVIV
jgi:hypothetical protein